MNVLIDIGHPAHVHLFKKLAFDLIQNDDSVIFSIRSGEKESELLDELQLPYKIIGTRQKGTFRKILGLFFFSLKILILARKHDVDLFLSHGSMYAGYAARFRKKPHIALEDSGNMEQLRFSIPVSDVILTPDILVENLGDKQIRYKGNHELIYLHPEYFNPESCSPDLIKSLEKEKYCVLRFSKFDASHDKKQQGMNLEEKLKLVEFLIKNNLKIIISSEGKLPDELTKYAYTFSPNVLHFILARAELVVSEGATIASEAGVLGVPTIYINSIIRCYNEELEDFGLLYNFRSFDGVTTKINEILSIKNYKIEYKKKQSVFVNSKIIVADFLNWFVLNYPESKDIMKDNPDFQFQFGGRKKSMV